jgi:Mg2+-importing ATPase
VAGQIDLLPAGGRVYTGDEIASMTPDELAKTVRQSSVFARVSPQQKYAIIQALKVYEVVGYQGDGINDAPALKLADVGIAVDSATDVAKSSADIILLKPDLAVIINGIRYGRAIFANINKYIKYTMVGNFGNYFALTALFLVSFTLPLLPRQVLLISLLTDVPLVTIATDTVSDDEVLRPEKYDVHSLMFISLVLGSLTALFELAFFATLSGQTAGFAETSLYLFFSFTQLVVIFSIRSKVHFWREQPPSRPLTIAIGATFLVMLALPYIGPLAAIFAFVPLPLSVLALIIGASALYLVVLDIVKVWYYQTIPAHPTGHG